MHRSAAAGSGGRSGPDGGGGGDKYAPMPWTPYFDAAIDVAIPGTGDVFHVYTAGSEGPVVLCLHGGGYSGLSFALAAKHLREQVRVVAPDLRGHGSSRTADDRDLSSQTLCKDVVALVQAMFGDNPPAIVLVGHSMGGAIAVRVAASRELPTLAALVVIDVVEGTAMSSLQFMQSILANRPSSFPSLEKAIEWSVRCGSLRNLDSARVSVPSTLRQDPASGKYKWLTPLEESEPYWLGWYEGLSDVFLSCPVAKLLLLAGTDRLDKSLTIAQMQGRFQMLVVRHAGHAIQEDDPDEFASAVLAFVSRNRIGPRGAEGERWRRGGGLPAARGQTPELPPTPVACSERQHCAAETRGAAVWLGKSLQSPAALDQGTLIDQLSHFFVMERSGSSDGGAPSDDVGGAALTTPARQGTPHPSGGPVSPCSLQSLGQAAAVPANNAGPADEAAAIMPDRTCVERLAPSGRQAQGPVAFVNMKEQAAAVGTRAGGSVDGGGGGGWGGALAGPPKARDELAAQQGDRAAKRHRKGLVAGPVNGVRIDRDAGGNGERRHKEEHCAAVVRPATADCDSARTSTGAATADHEAASPLGERGARKTVDKAEARTCCICNVAEDELFNPILLCGGCGIAVHQPCYGVMGMRPIMTSTRWKRACATWLCRKCEAVAAGHANVAARRPGGALKRTSSPGEQWAHVVCALFTPEASFGDPDVLEPVLGVAGIEARIAWKPDYCSVCGSKQGSAARCSAPGCFATFHVSCGLAADATFMLRGLDGSDDMVIFCPTHAEINVYDRCLTISPGTPPGWLSSVPLLQELSSRRGPPASGKLVTWYQSATFSRPVPSPTTETPSSPPLSAYELPPVGTLRLPWTSDDSDCGQARAEEGTDRSPLRAGWHLDCKDASKREGTCNAGHLVSRHGSGCAVADACTL
eukprot:SM000121S26027  [mRNA]  locus=s121:420840:431708:- [translate_table: standard]